MPRRSVSATPWDPKMRPGLALARRFAIAVPDAVLGVDVGGLIYFCFQLGSKECTGHT